MECAIGFLSVEREVLAVEANGARLTHSSQSRVPLDAGGHYGRAQPMFEAGSLAGYPPADRFRRRQPALLISTFWPEAHTNG